MDETTNRPICMEDLNLKFNEMQEKMMHGINQAMQTTACNLDQTADKLHNTAEFFREKNCDSLKFDSEKIIKKYPFYSIGTAVILGLFVGKILSK